MIFFYIFRLRTEAKELIASSTTKSNRTQTEVTEKLGERVQSISYWKFELERGIQDMTSKENTSIQNHKVTHYGNEVAAWLSHLSIFVIVLLSSKTPVCFSCTYSLGEIDLMVDEIRRVENAIQATESPMLIARDCLANRQRRIDSDLVQDDAEKALLRVCFQVIELDSSRASSMEHLLLFAVC